MGPLAHTSYCVQVLCMCTSYSLTLCCLNCTPSVMSHQYCMPHLFCLVSTAWPAFSVLSHQLVYRIQLHNIYIIFQHAHFSSNVSKRFHLLHYDTPRGTWTCVCAHMQATWHMKAHIGLWMKSYFLRIMQRPLLKHCWMTGDFKFWCSMHTIVI